MRSRNAIYKIIRALWDSSNASYEVRISQGTETYGTDKLISCKLVSNLIGSGNGITIGKACSTECDLVLLEDSANWARMAKFNIELRLKSGSDTSNWISMGKFYTDTRSEDEYGRLQIVAYDGMLLTEQSWSDKIPEQYLPESYPITAREWAEMIQNAELFTFADLTQLDNTVAFVGLDTTSTVREVLQSIATVHGGNWMMTSSETLKLIPFVNVDIQTASSNDYINLGTAVEDFTTSPALDAVTKVHLETEGGTVAEYGTDTGYKVSGTCNFSTTTGVAELCHSKINGYVYKPFTAINAVLDPIAEVGDALAVDGEMYQIMAINWEIFPYPTATVTAPYDQEVDHEYTIPSEQAKNYRKAMAAVAEQMDEYVPWDEVSTAIEQNAESVVIAASGTYVTQTEYDATIAEIQNQIDGNIQSWSGNVVPTLNNSPAVDWNTTALKNEHVGDMYFVNSDAGIPEAGNYYRFENNNGTYSWQLITDSVATEALARATAAMAAAESAEETADASMTEVQLKGRIFVVQPTPPYSVGDLWFNDTNSEIKVCINARTSGGFASDDWVKRDKYTDDSAFNAFRTAYAATIAAIEGQIDQKAETYYQEADPINDWEATVAGVAIAGISVVGFDGEIGLTHKGDLWYRTTDNTTWFWDGTQWVQQDVPDEVFDKIDNKAQIFIAQPYPPYNVGDLWFDSANSDIMTCVTARDTGSFVSGDWQKRNKYTDDSALTTFVNATYNPAIAAIQADLDGKVDTYFYAYAPTLQNAPASSWTTTDLKDTHVDDLFFDTVSGYTYRFKKSGTTYSWERVKDSDITSAMTAASAAQDTADGKRRVFVAQPTKAQAYDIGDLWVNATYGTTYSNDLLRCKTAKAAGATFNISHWELASKYTDDSAADAVSQQLTQFESRFSVQPEQIDAEISKRVIKDHTETKTTFGWEMTDTYHKWYANNQEIVRIQQSGVFVKGEIRATSGYIGNDTNGFEINATNIHNGMTSLSDTTHNGVYVGTDGIALGMGKFKATSSGSVTASDLSITGGSIKLGGTAQNPVFQVTSAGAVTASNMSILGGSITIKDGSNNVIFSANSSGVTVNGNGRFTGTVYAANIVTEATQTGAGYITGSQIGSGEVDTDNLAIGAVDSDILDSQSVSHSKLQLQAVAGENVVQHTLTDLEMGINELTTQALSTSIGNSLGLADIFGLAINSSSGTYPSYFCATSITALSSMYANEYYIELGGDRTLALKTHYHTITVSQDGTVQFGQPTSTQPSPFNVADTKKYRDDVAAVTVTSLDLEYTYDSSMHIYRLMGYAKNASGTIVYQSSSGQWNTDRSAYVDGKADGAAEVTVDTVTQYSYSSTGNKSVTLENAYVRYNNGNLVGRVQIALDGNSNKATCVVTMDGTRAYNAGKASVTTTAPTLDTSWATSSTGYIYRSAQNRYEVRVKSNANGVESTSGSVYVGATDAYDAGSTAGVASVTCSTLGLDTSWSTSSTGYSYQSSNRRYAVRGKATLSNGVTYSATMYVPDTDAYNAGYAAGGGGSGGNVTVSTLGIDPNGTISYSSTVNNYYIPILATLSTGVNSRTTTITVSGQEAYDAGVNSITVTDIGLNTGWSTSSTGYIYETANNRYAASIRVTLSSGSAWADTVYIPATDAYNAGRASASGLNHGAVLVTDSSNYTTYDRGYSWSSGLFNPTLSSGGSSVYGRIGLYDSSNTIIAIYRMAMSMSVTSASTSYDPSDYYQSGGRWYLKVHVKNSGNEIYQAGVDVQQAVDYGAASGGGGTEYRLYCTNRTENSAGLVTCDFSISSYNGLPWRANNYYTFTYD